MKQRIIIAMKKIVTCLLAIMGLMVSCKQKYDSVAPEPPTASEPTSLPSHSSSSSYSGSSSSSSDNMRGFDPASENDMDDNGMSRYMENNDDEGWD